MLSERVHHRFVHPTSKEDERDLDTHLDSETIAPGRPLQTEQEESLSSSSSSSISAVKLIIWMLTVAVAYMVGFISASSSLWMVASSPMENRNEMHVLFPTNTSTISNNFDYSIDLPPAYSGIKTASNHDAGFACKGFFTMMVSAFVPSDNILGRCSKMYDRYRIFLEDHNRQMLRMNSTLTLFTTWTPLQLSQERHCHLNDLPGIRVQQFDPVALLQKHGYTNQQIHWIQGWHDAAYEGMKKKRLAKRTHQKLIHPYSARLADIFRIILAKEFQLAYIELDMMLLSPHPRVYLSQPVLSMPVWAEKDGSLETQNSGFCLTAPQLSRVIQRQQEIIQSKGPQQAVTNMYHNYTELGPNVLNHVFQKMAFHRPIKTYLTNCNDDANVKRVVLKHEKYKFVWLHLDSRFRGGNLETLEENLIELRNLCQPPSIAEIFPQQKQLD